MQVTEFVERAGPLVGASGSAFYFADQTVATGRSLGLDALHFYDLGRGAVLGDAPPAVVHSAFGGYFGNGIVERIWSEARLIVDPRVAAVRFFECSAPLGRLLFEDLELSDLRGDLEAVVEAAPTSGLPLFRGNVALPPATDAAGRTMQLLTALRELRGDAHLVSLLALGIDPRVAHYVRRPEHFESFGWGLGDVPILDGGEEDRLAAAEDLTDAIVTPSFAVVPVARRAAVLKLLGVLHARLQDAGRGTPVVPAPGRRLP